MKQFRVDTQIVLTVPIFVEAGSESEADDKASRMLTSDYIYEENEDIYYVLKNQFHNSKPTIVSIKEIDNCYDGNTYCWPLVTAQ